MDTIFTGSYNEAQEFTGATVTRLFDLMTEADKLYKEEPYTTGIQFTVQERLALGVYVENDFRIMYVGGEKPFKIERLNEKITELK